MDIEKLKTAIEVAKLLECDAKPSAPAGGRAIIVRSRDAGVIFGKYAGNDRDTVHVTDAVQMWRWKAAKGGTLLDCAEYGVDATGCKFSFSKGKVTVFNACAMIDCTDEAAKSISAVKGGEWK